MSSELAIRSETNTQLVPSSIEEAINFASVMAEARLLPPHLLDSPSDCLAVVMQAGRWGMDPFAVAQKTSLIKGKMMYEGQLVAAVINARGNLDKRLNYIYSGEGEARKVKCVGRIRGEEEDREVEVTLKEGKAQAANKDVWAKQPDQQLAYMAARVWARRHMPELILGVYTPDEQLGEDIHIGADNAKNVTPEKETKRPPAPKRTKGVQAAVKKAEETADAPPAADPKEPEKPGDDPIDVETSPGRKVKVIGTKKRKTSAGGLILQVTVSDGDQEEKLFYEDTDTDKFPDGAEVTIWEDVRKATVPNKPDLKFITDVR